LRSRPAVLLILILLFSCNRGEVNTSPQTHTPPKKTEDKKVEQAQGLPENKAPEAVYTYNPEGKRDPFKPAISNEVKKELLKIPPLQRVEPKDLKLLGIAWGWFGYSAMVQTPDGKAYPIRVGTQVGPRNGSVKSIGERSLTIEERYTDIYGEKKINKIALELPLREEVQ
jgi:type IV pilus assembly protein PilP